MLDNQPDNYICIIKICIDSNSNNRILPFLEPVGNHEGDFWLAGFTELSPGWIVSKKDGKLDKKAVTQKGI